MAKIKTKTMLRGNQHESSWPSDYGEGARGRFHIDKETKTARPGNPPPKIKRYGTAPMIRGDDMPETLCHADGKYYTSKSRMEQTHKAMGFEQCHGESDKSWTRQEADSVSEVTDATERAYNMLKNDEVYFTEEQKHVCQETNKKLAVLEKRES